MPSNAAAAPACKTPDRDAARKASSEQEQEVSELTQEEAPMDTPTRRVGASGPQAQTSCCHTQRNGNWGHIRYWH
ncbi:hypothetical protein SRHO_G00075280 [Serrasalmus rhombeus]